MSAGNWLRRLPRLLRAAMFATVVVGGLATGLGLTTYTIAKTNDAVFGPGMLLAVEPSAPAAKCSLD